MTLPVLAEVVRSGYREGRHTGSLVVLRPDGSVLLGLGDLERPIFPRSSNKPLQAVGLLSQGWNPDDEEQVALAAASHGGEPSHVEVVLRQLRQGGLDATALRCPPSLPLYEPAAWALLASGGHPTVLHMNCSGKHAAMLATALVADAPLHDYLDPGHAVQGSLLATIERLAGEPVRHVAVDGCGAPQHALTLPGLARAFAAIALAGPGTCENRVARAMREHPFLVAGTGRDATALMQGVPGLIAKDGAEGVYAGALPDGSAVALKIEDGAARARTPVFVAALRLLGVPGDALEQWATTPVLGGGRPVGNVSISAELAHLTQR